MPTTATSPSMRIHSWSLVYLTALIDASREGGGKSAVIAMRHERQRHDARRTRRPPHQELDGGAERGLGRRHIAHGDRPVDGGAEAAAGDAAGRRAARVDDLCPFTRGRAALGLEADALA